MQQLASKNQSGRLEKYSSIFLLIVFASSRIVYPVCGFGFYSQVFICSHVGLIASCMPSSLTTIPITNMRVGKD